MAQRVQVQGTGDRPDPVAEPAEPSAAVLPVRLPRTLPGRGGGAALGALARRVQRGAGNHVLARALATAPREAASRPVLARRLIATGDVERFRALIEPAIGLQLAHDAATGQITAVGTLATPATSPSLAALIQRIIADAGQDAEVHFGAGQPGVLGGAFPTPRDLTGATFQQIDLDDMEAFEAGAPGYGIAALAHEIAENYEAHAHVPAAPGTDLFPAAHQAGLQAENAVLADVVGPGGRIATRIALDPSGSRIVTFDFENYFMIFDVVPSSLAGGGTDFQVSNVRRTARNVLSTHVIDHYVTGADAIPPAGGGVPATALAALQAAPHATAHVEGFTDDVGAAAVNDPLSQRRAQNVLAAMTALDPALGGAMHDFGRGAAGFVAPNATEADRARNRRVVITIAEPAP